MKIIGIDPGSHRTGYAILSLENKKTSIIHYGTIDVPTKVKHPNNLLLIKKELIEVLVKHKPLFASVEELFFNKNQKTVSRVFEARGCILLTLLEFGITIVEPTVKQIKKGVTGNGNASKDDIKKCIELIFGMKNLIGHDDSWDAIAAAFVGLMML